MNCEGLFENENPEGRASVVLKAPSKGSPDDGAAWLAAGARAPGAGRGGHCSLGHPSQI